MASLAGLTLLFGQFNVPSPHLPRGEAWVLQEGVWSDHIEDRKIAGWEGEVLSERRDYPALGPSKDSLNRTS